jgi:type IV pilus assembly protein PilM
MAKNVAVGLDIGTSSIKVVELHRRGSSIQLNRFGVKPIPFGSLDGGAIKSPQILADYIKQAMAESRIKTKDVVIAVAGQTVIVRHIKFPIMERSELANAIQFEAERYIPFPVEEASIDFEIISTDTVSNEMEVMLVATQRQLIESHIQALLAAGLQPIAIDVQPFALIRSLGLLASQTPGTTVILDIGAGTSDLLIYKGGSPRFTRIIPIAGSRITQAIADAYGCSFEEADKLKIKYADALGSQVEGDQGRVYNAIRGILDEMIIEIRRSIDYYRLQQRSDDINQVVIAGGGAKLPNCEELFSRELGMRVSKGNPLYLLNSNHISEEILNYSPILAVSIGLALREVE